MAKGNLIQKLVKWTALGKNDVVKDHYVQQLAPNIKAAVTIIVEKLPEKKDYTDTILHLRANGVSFKRISEILGISYSYVCKLFRDATKNV